MHVHVLQHVPFEGLGSIHAWLRERGATITWTRFFEDPSLPSLTAVDFVIALGGPMSANDEAELPWLRDEKRFLANAIAGDKAVLGVCLGAQLIASALGARVFRNVEKEIGWFPIFGDPAPAGCFSFPAKSQVFHWHGETFEMPHGAVQLAHSAACRNQAFQVGGRALGLQFHLETTRESAGAMLSHLADELMPARYVQTSAQLRVAPEKQYAAINAMMADVLEYLVGDSANR